MDMAIPENMLLILKLDTVLNSDAFRPEMTAIYARTAIHSLDELAKPAQPYNSSYY